VLRLGMWRVLPLVLALTLVGVACDGGQRGEGTTEQTAGGPVELAIAPTAPLPSYWPFYYVAEGLGFYADENLEVQVATVRGAVQQALITGRLQVAGTGLDYLPQAADEEISDELKYFMITDNYPWVMITFEDSPYESAADLRGRRIGVNDPHDTFDAEFLMGAAGVPQGEYELIPVGEDRAALVAMERGDVDAFMGPYLAVNTLNELSDRPIRVITNQVAEDYYNTGPMVTADLRENDRDVVVRFGRAIARAMVWQYENPEVAARTMLEVDPTSATDFEEALEFIQTTNEWNRSRYEARGSVDPAIYQTMIDKHADLGFIDEPYPADRLFTNELIEEIWDFDVEAEIEAARNAS
jgi:NitT/TauT family transport system substrate-binding protein